MDIMKCRKIVYNNPNFSERRTEQPWNLHEPVKGASLRADTGEIFGLSRNRVRDSREALDDRD